MCYTGNSKQQGGRTVKERYSLIDAIRGLAVVNMVLYHFLFDVYILQGFNVNWRSIPGVHIWQQCICWTFILVSGLSFHLSGHRLRNGLLINGCGILVTVVTLIAEPQEAIWCGVLTLLGCSLLLATALKPLLEKIPAVPGAIFSFLIFLLTGDVQIRWLSFLGEDLYRLPDALYQTNWLTIFGFPRADFYSSDYFPIFPWFFLYLTGLFAGRMILKHPPEWLKGKIPVLDWIGRHSLIIYMAHQPVAMVVSMLVAIIATR